MQNKQIKILRYIYDTPRTFSEIKRKFNFDDSELKKHLDGDDGFSSYYEGYHRDNDFDNNAIVASNLGRAFVDGRNRKNITDYVPIIISIISVVIATPAFILALIALIG